MDNKPQKKILDYYKTELIRENMITFYNLYAETQDTEDFVDKKINDKLCKLIYKEQKKSLKEVNKEYKLYYKEKKKKYKQQLAKERKDKNKKRREQKRLKRNVKRADNRLKRLKRKNLREINRLKLKDKIKTFFSKISKNKKGGNK